MRLNVILEHRFHATPDGMLWSQTAFPYTFWQRYLSVFDQVNIVARVLEVSSVPEDFKRVDGEKVSFTALPHYIGPLGYLRHRFTIKNMLGKAFLNADAVLFRIPSHIAWSARSFLSKKKRPYAVEVVGDPWSVFSPGAVKHPLRFFFRWYFRHQTKHQCAEAACVAYVTEFTLQQSYPATGNAYITNYSSIELQIGSFSFARNFDTHVPRRIVFVGSLAQLYKAPDVLLGSVLQLKSRGKNIQLTIIGDGFFRHSLESFAKAMNIEDCVEFLGQISSGKAINDELDKADLFVLPSRTEGLPRAMIEAMARGLPCIGSTVGGIPELLPAECLVKPGDPVALAEKIDWILSRPEKMTRMSARNIEKAKEYSDEVLNARRTAFYNELKKRTLEWQGNGQR